MCCWSILLMCPVQQLHSGDGRSKCISCRASACIKLLGLCPLQHSLHWALCMLPCSGSAWLFLCCWAPAAAQGRCQESQYLQMCVCIAQPVSSCASGCWQYSHRKASASLLIAFGTDYFVQQLLVLAAVHGHWLSSWVCGDVLRAASVV